MAGSQVTVVSSSLNETCASGKLQLGALGAKHSKRELALHSASSLGDPKLDVRLGVRNLVVQHVAGVWIVHRPLGNTAIGLHSVDVPIA